MDWCGIAHIGRRLPTELPTEMVNSGCSAPGALHPQAFEVGEKGRGHRAQSPPTEAPIAPREHLAFDHTSGWMADLAFDFLFGGGAGAGH